MPVMAVVLSLRHLEKTVPITGLKQVCNCGCLIVKSPGEDNVQITELKHVCCDCCLCLEGIWRRRHAYTCMWLVINCAVVVAGGCPAWKRQSDSGLGAVSCFQTGPPFQTSQDGSSAQDHPGRFPHQNKAQKALRRW